MSISVWVAYPKKASAVMDINLFIKNQLHLACELAGPSAVRRILQPVACDDI